MFPKCFRRFNHNTSSIASLSTKQSLILNVNNGVRAMATTAKYLDKERGLNISKSDMHALYVQPDPTDYAKALSALNYGIFQDFFLDFAKPLVEKHIKVEKPSIVDLGALYGNTTLAVVAGLDWKGTTQFWFDDKKEHLNKTWKTTGVDLSDNALDYGKERGIFDETFIVDLNEIDKYPKKLIKSIRDCDVLTCIMASNYVETDNWNHLIDIFLSDRSKNKLLFYNLVLAFDERLFEMGAQSGFGKHNKIDFYTKFCKHRDFTEQESKGHQNGGRESWTMLYGIHAKPLI